MMLRSGSALRRAYRGRKIGAGSRLVIVVSWSSHDGQGLTFVEVGICGIRQSNREESLGS